MLNFVSMWFSSKKATVVTRLESFFADLNTEKEIVYVRIKTFEFLYLLGSQGNVPFTSQGAFSTIGPRSLQWQVDH